MKVLDIISEAQPSPGVNFTFEDAVVKSWLEKNPHLQLTNKYDAEAGNFFSRWINKNARANLEAELHFKTKFGTAFALLKAAGLIEQLVITYNRLRALNDQVYEKGSDGQLLHTRAWIEDQQNAIVGTFLATQMVPLILSSIKRGVLIGALSDLLAGAAMRTPGGVYIRLAAVIAEQGAIIWLQNWLQTAEGQDWLLHGVFIPIIVKGAGGIANNMLDWARKKIKDGTGIDVGVVTPNVNKELDKAPDFEMPPQDYKASAAKDKAQDMANLR